MVEVRSRIVYTGRSTMHSVNEVLWPGAASAPSLFTRVEFASTSR